MRQCADRWKSGRNAGTTYSDAVSSPFETVLSAIDAGDASSSLDCHRDE